MNKNVSCFIFAFVLVFILSACSEGTSALKNTEVSTKEVQDDVISFEEDYWHLACENTDVVLYKNYGANGFEFELISTFPIEEEELALKVETVDPSVSYQVSYYKQDSQEDEIFPFYIYQCYKGMDWKYIKRLEQEDNNSNSEELSNLQNLYREEYQNALEQGKLPELYSYMVGIRFDLAKMNSIVNIDAISVTLKGKTKRYALDSFVLDAVEEFNFKNEGILSTMGILDAPIHVSSEGILDLTEIDLHSEKPFRLTGLSFLKRNVKDISDCTVTLTKADGKTTEMEWDTKTPIAVMKGESISVQAYCKDTHLAGVLEATVTKDIIVHYESEEGTPYTEIMQGIYRMRPGMYDVYAEKGGANVLSYYLDYKLPAEDEEKTYE